jgi:hypothetical protein
MSTDILSQYIDELLAGRERPLQEYLLQNPEQQEELLPLLVGALAVHRSLADVEPDPSREEASRKRALEELARVLAENEDLTRNGALTRFVERLKKIIGGEGRE